MSNDAYTGDSSELVALGAGARRAAKSIGLRSIRSRKRRNSADNKGGFQIIDPMRNLIVAGEHLDLSPEDVIAFCYGVAETPITARPWVLTGPVDQTAQLA